ncbi:unnamed protein product [marine sediment metagenome]|uniref:Uncharacterized protein n=1 Tax=marine sediment metagenome TaxID=412755 RepID=X1Q483_9ZZZZ
MDIFVAVALIFAVAGVGIVGTGLCAIVQSVRDARKEEKKLNDKLSRMNKKVDKIGELLKAEG